MGRQTEIVFSARDNGVDSLMSRLRSSATELSRGMASEAISNTSNAKDAVRHYEDQIKLIERRNRLESQAAKISLERQRDKGLESAGDNKDKQREVKDDYQKNLKSIQTGSKEDQLQVELLRELIDEVRNSAKEENRAEDGRSHADRIHEERLNLRGGIVNFGRESNDSNTREESTRGGRSSRGGGRNTSDEIGGVLEGDAGSAAGSAIGMVATRIPAIAAAYGAFKGATAVWGAKEDQELQLRELAGLSGVSIGALMDRDVGGTKQGGYGPVDLNVSREEFRSTVLPQVSRAQGSIKGILGESGVGMQALEIQKGMGIGPEIVSSLIQSLRTTENPGSVQNTTQHLYRRLDAEGAYGERGMDMSRMSDIMESFVNLKQGAFMRHGEMTGTGMYIDLLGRFEGLGGAYKNDQYKTSTIQSLDRGMTSSSSPEVEAIKMGILRDLNPEKGFFDLQAEMEKGVESKGFLDKTLQYVRNTGGDMNSQKILFDQLTGGSMRKADITRMLESKDFKSASLGMGYVMGGDRSFDFKERALNASSSVAADAMWMNEWWEDTKTSIFDGFKEYVTDPIVNAISGLADWF